MTLILQFRQAEALLWRSSASECCLTPVSEFQVIFIYFIAILVPWHYTLLGILPLFLLVVLLNCPCIWFCSRIVAIGMQGLCSCLTTNQNSHPIWLQIWPPSCKQMCSIIHTSAGLFPAQCAAGVITPNNWQSYSCGGVQRILAHKKVQTVITTVLHARL